jgi:hypothetical protein
MLKSQPYIPTEKKEERTYPIVPLTPLSPPTVDEELLCSAFNRAVAGDASPFAALFDRGSMSYQQARSIVRQLTIMGYCITERPF